MISQLCFAASVSQANDSGRQIDSPASLEILTEPNVGLLEDGRNGTVAVVDTTNDLRRTLLAKYAIVSTSTAVLDTGIEKELVHVSARTTQLATKSGIYHYAYRKTSKDLRAFTEYVNDAGSVVESISNPLTLGSSAEKIALATSRIGNIVHIAWIESGGSLKVRTSTNAGTTYSAEVLVNTGADIRYIDMATDETGQIIFIIWVNDADDQVYVARSEDFGATFPQLDKIVIEFGAKSVGKNPRIATAGNGSQRSVLTFLDLSSDYPRVSFRPPGAAANFDIGRAIYSNASRDAQAIISRDGETSVYAWVDTVRNEVFSVQSLEIEVFQPVVSVSGGLNTIDTNSSMQLNTVLDTEANPSQVNVGLLSYLTQDDRIAFSVGYKTTLVTVDSEGATSSIGFTWQNSYAKTHAEFQAAKFFRMANTILATFNRIMSTIIAIAENFAAVQDVQGLQGVQGPQNLGAITTYDMRIYNFGYFLNEDTNISITR